MADQRIGPGLRLLFRVPRHMYDWHLGWMFGKRFICITHLGRKSGRTYRTVVEVIDIDHRTGEILIISGFGPKSDWYRNLQAHPAVEVQIGRRRFTPEQRNLPLPEARAALAVYARRHRLLVKRYAKLLGRVAGVELNGTPEGFLTLADHMPMLGFRPPD